MTTGKTFSEKNGLAPVVRDDRMQDVYWTYSYRPIYETTGEIVGISVVFQDNAEQALAERERDALAKQLSQVFDGM